MRAALVKNAITLKIVQPLAAIGCGVVFSSPAFRVDEDGESSDSQTNWRNAARLEAISGRRPYVYTTGYAKPGSGPQKLMRLYQADGGAHQAGPSTSLDLQNFATEASSVVLSGAAGRSVRKRGRRCRTHRA